MPTDRTDSRLDRFDDLSAAQRAAATGALAQRIADEEAWEAAAEREQSQRFEVLDQIRRCRAALAALDAGTTDRDLADFIRRLAAQA